MTMRSGSQQTRASSSAARSHLARSWRWFLFLAFLGVASIANIGRNLGKMETMETMERLAKRVEDEEREEMTSEEERKRFQVNVEELRSEQRKDWEIVVDEDENVFPKTRLEVVDLGELMKGGRHMKEMTISVVACAEYLEQRRPMQEWFMNVYKSELERLLGGKTEVKVVERPLENISIGEPFDAGFRTFVWLGSPSSSSCVEKSVQDRLWYIYASQRHLPVHLKPIVSVKLSVEVFETPSCDAKSVDIIFDRRRDRKTGKCRTIHYFQGIQFDARKTPPYDTGKLCEPSYRSRKAAEEHWEQAMTSKKLFLLSSNSVIKRSHHFGDALVRIALFALLAEKYGTDKAYGTNFIREIRHDAPEYKLKNCEGNDLKATLCKAEFLITLDMENSSFDGYISEKIFSGFLAGTLPVYFGDPYIEEFINPKRFINCNLPEETVLRMRAQKKDRRFSFDLSNRNPKHIDILRFAMEFLREDLQPCISKIDKILNDKDLYVSMVSEPVFLNRKLVCSQKPYRSLDFARNFVEALHLADSTYVH